MVKVGKLPISVLKSKVLSRVRSRGATVLPPAVGEDAAVIRLRPGVLLVIHSDPITEAVGDIGWYAVHVAANDVAVTGAEPRWFLMTILLPEAPEALDILDDIMDGIERALREVGGELVGGHTEVTPRLDRPIVVATAFGLPVGRGPISTGGAKPGDVVLLTKAAGLEGTSIIARDFEEALRRRGVAEEVIERARGYASQISVVKEALTLAKLGASSMHDPTEGGILGGLLELAIASGTTIKVEEVSIPVRPETRLIASALSLDPLKLIASGSLIASIERGKANGAIEALRREGIECSIVGHVEEGPPRLILRRRDGKLEVYDEGTEITDELARLWEQHEADGGADWNQRER